jgi:hypothetical protein
MIRSCRRLFAHLLFPPRLREHGRALDTAEARLRSHKWFRHQASGILQLLEGQGLAVTAPPVEESPPYSNDGIPSYSDRADGSSTAQVGECLPRLHLPFLRHERSRRRRSKRTQPSVLDPTAAISRSPACAASPRGLTTQCGGRGRVPNPGSPSPTTNIYDTSAPTPDFNPFGCNPASATCWTSCEDIWAAACFATVSANSRSRPLAMTARNASGSTFSLRFAIGVFPIMDLLCGKTASERFAGERMSDYRRGIGAGVQRPNY